MSKLKIVLFSLIAFAISFFAVVLIKYNPSSFGAEKLYRVYLEGKTIGLIESKKDLEEYIDEKQQAIKNKYNVESVYTPKKLEIREELTYNNNVKTIENIYKTIEQDAAFTIEGYKVTIYKETLGEDKGDGSEVEVITEKKYLYVLNKEILETAIDNTITSFVGEEEYQAYKEQNQMEITDEGEIIENVYIDEKVTLKKEYISINETIFTDAKDLTSYLMFGTTDIQKKYKVKSGDTIAKIANANRLAPIELLIANNDLGSENSLLYEGQEIVIGLIDPVLTVVEEIHSVESQEVKFSTQIIEDSSMYAGYSKIEQKGVNGVTRVTQKIKLKNEEIVSAINISTEEITPPVTQIVKAGSRTHYIVASTDLWGWPTRTPYKISSYYEYRWGRMHNGIDITGTGGKGSPIYAVNDGTVTTAKYTGDYGYHVVINHNNGYTTLYAHLNKMYVVVGQGVHRGDVIGGMGTTGRSTGVHLHFEVRRNGNRINPFLIYQ